VSEWISLARFYLTPNLVGSEWASSWRRSLDAVLNDCANNKDAADAGRAGALLGSLCILGGFTEPLREGGLIRISVRGSSEPPARAVVLRYCTGSQHISVLRGGEGRGEWKQVLLLLVKVC